MNICCSAAHMADMPVGEVYSVGCCLLLESHVQPLTAVEYVILSMENVGANDLVQPMECEPECLIVLHGGKVHGAPHASVISEKLAVPGVFFFLQSLQQFGCLD